MKKFFVLLLLGLLSFQSAAYAAWPSSGARTKEWSSGDTLTDTDLEGQYDVIWTYINDALNSSSGHAHDGTTSNGPKVNITNLTVGSQAQGDIIYASSASAWARLGAGTSGQFLKTQGASANPTWATINFQTAASQAEMEAASSTSVPVTPGRTQYHPGVAKAWVSFAGSDGSILASYGVTSVTKNIDGNYTITWSTAFSSANYVVIGTAQRAAGGSDIVSIPSGSSPGTTSCQVDVRTAGDTLDAASKVFVAAFGDQ